MQNKKHLHWLVILGSTMLVTTGIFFYSFAADPTPTCDGQTATIWVDGSNMEQPANVPYTGELTGTAGDDVIVGTDNDDIINGKNGDDIICGLDGKDTIEGNKGKDTIFGGAGADTIDGGNGKDTIEGNGGKDFIKGGNNDDTIKGNAGADIICGEDGDDVIKGNGGDDKIDANGGNDDIDGGNDTDICLDGDVATTDCEDTTTDIVECNVSTGGSSGGLSGGWKRCGNQRVRINEDCPSDMPELKGAAEEAEKVEEVSKQCLLNDADRASEFALSDMVYYHDAALAMYSTFATDTDPKQYFVEGEESADFMTNHLSVDANGFTKYQAAVEWALLANCYQLSEDVMKQASDMGFISEDADPEQRLTQEELLNLLLTVSELEDDAYVPENYTPNMKLLRRDAWQWVLDVATLTDKLDDASKDILKSYFE